MGRRARLINGICSAVTASFELVRGASLEGVPMIGAARMTAIIVALAGLSLAMAAPTLRSGSLLVALRHSLSSTNLKASAPKYLHVLPFLAFPDEND